mmetsp:Transcript_3694/g.7307  ORF Transcript_3694/g.7307 Transcript_3694/m.7307 type:complete len:241 (+) Transcript_3694:87-809(+)
MRRPNHASRAAASTALRNTTGSTKTSADVTLRPGDSSGDHGVAVAAGPTTLAGLEQEVECLRKAMEKEAAEVASMQASLGELFMRNSCEEYLHKLERRIQVIENKEVDVVHWRIENVEELRQKYSRGQFLASPEFSACGLDGFRFHVYLRGDDFCEEGYVSLYFHVPADTTVMRTLFMGRARHGPAEADSIKNCGVSELCVLSNEMDRETGSIVVGVDGLQVLSSPGIVEKRTKLQLGTS